MLRFDRYTSKYVFRGDDSNQIVCHRGISLDEHLLNYRNKCTLLSAKAFRLRFVRDARCLLKYTSPRETDFARNYLLSAHCDDERLQKHCGFRVHLPDENTAPIIRRCDL